MHRFTLRLIIALLTFIIGVGASAAWFIVRRPFAVKSNAAAIPTVQDKREKTIVGGIAGEGISADGYPTSFSNHEYSDGTSIHQMSVFYRSSKRANVELQKRIKEADAIIRREPVLDEQGRQIGERVVATFVPYKGSSVDSAELLWTEGSRYVSQKRSSLQSILNDLDSNR